MPLLCKKSTMHCTSPAAPSIQMKSEVCPTYTLFAFLLTFLPKRCNSTEPARPSTTSSIAVILCPLLLPFGPHSSFMQFLIVSSLLPSFCTPSLSFHACFIHCFHALIVIPYQFHTIFAILSNLFHYSFMLASGSILPPNTHFHLPHPQICLIPCF